MLMVFRLSRDYPQSIERPLSLRPRFQAFHFIDLLEASTEQSEGQTFGK